MIDMQYGLRTMWFLRIFCPFAAVFFGVPAIYRISQGDWWPETVSLLLLSAGLIRLTVLAWKR